MTGKKGTTHHKWTDEERSRLAEIAPGRSHAEIREIMTDEFGDHFGGKRIAAALKRYGIKTGRTGRFEKGNAGGFRDEAHKAAFLEAGRATRFKRGEVHGYAAQHERPVGSERVNSDGYVEVKVADGLQRKANSNFRMKHHVAYEQAHGMIPSGCNVVFADRDKRNFDPGNLVAIPRKYVGQLNNPELPGYHDRESLLACVALCDLRGKLIDAENARPRTCGVCGKPFTPAERQRACPQPPKTCPDCLAAGKRARGDRGDRKPTVCAVCGQVFAREQRNQRRCPECKAAKPHYGVRWHRAYYERHGHR